MKGSSVSTAAGQGSPRHGKPDGSRARLGKVGFRQFSWWRENRDGARRPARGLPPLRRGPSFLETPGQWRRSHLPACSNPHKAPPNGLQSEEFTARRPDSSWEGGQLAVHPRSPGHSARPSQGEHLLRESESSAPTHWPCPPRGDPLHSGTHSRGLRIPPLFPPSHKSTSYRDLLLLSPSARSRVPCSIPWSPYFVQCTHNRSPNSSLRKF